MPIKIRSIDEVINTAGMKFLIYGEAGSGKTTLLSTAQGEILLIVAEAGLLSLQDLPDETKKRIHVIVANDVDDMREAFDIAEQGRCVEGTDAAEADVDPVYVPWDWVAIDPITEVAESCLASEKMNQKDGRAAYGNTADIMKSLIKAFIALETNVIMTAHHGVVDISGNNNMRQHPAMPGKQLEKIPHFFDFVWKTTVHSNEETGERSIYLLQTERDETSIAKTRGGGLEFYEKPNLTELVKKLSGRKPEEEKEENKEKEEGEWQS